LPWAFGLLTLFALVLVVLHFGTIEEFSRLAWAARPEWLFLAGVAQAATAYKRHSNTRNAGDIGRRYQKCFVFGSSVGLTSAAHFFPASARASVPSSHFGRILDAIGDPNQHVCSIATGV
jgi:hypothetical protein